MFGFEFIYSRLIAFWKTHLQNRLQFTRTVVSHSDLIMDNHQVDDFQVPSGDFVGHLIFLVASPDGRFHLVDKQSGSMYWTTETDGVLRVAEREENVNDYADVKQENYDSRMYHFCPNTLPRLIPFETKELLEEYFNGYYGDNDTDVSKEETEYHIDYQSGAVNRSFDPEREVVDSNASHFIVKRVDYYLQRPLWSLRCASIEAWFPKPDDEKCSRTRCVVYHAWNDQSYINGT